MDTNFPQVSQVCAITGTGGYLGGITKRKFEKEGWNVRALTRSPVDTKSIPFQLGEEIDPAALAGCNALVHCAYDFNCSTRRTAWLCNVAGTRKLLDAARLSGISRIIVISSISAFEGCKSVYGKSKLEIEKIGLDCGAMIIRPGLIFGKQGGGMFGKLVEQVTKSSLIPLIGDGKQIQYLVHEEDLADLIFRLCSGQIAVPNEIITAAYDHGWKFRDILLQIAHARGRKIHFVPIPWRLLWIALKILETLRVPIKFRSDSLISLNYQNPRPVFRNGGAMDWFPRPFDSGKI